MSFLLAQKGAQGEVSSWNSHTLRGNSLATPCLYSHTLSALLPHLKGVFKGNLKGNLNESLEESLKDLDKNQKSQLFPQKNIENEF